MTYHDSSSYEGKMNQIIWNNKYIFRSIFQPVFNNQGVLKVDDLISKEGVFLKSDKILNSSFPWPLLVLCRYGCFDSLPNKRNCVPYNQNKPLFALPSPMPGIKLVLN